MDNVTIKAVADATKAVAETTGRALDIVDGASTFASRLIGDALAAGVGILNDQVNHWRRMRLLQLEQKFNDACAARGFDPGSMKPLTLSQAVRALEAASLEEDDDVQDLWAELLANAVDPQADVTVKKLYVTLLKEMGPAEAALLKLLADFDRYRGVDFAPAKFAELERDLNGLAERKWRKFSDSDRQGAILNLRRMECIAPDFGAAPISRLFTQNAAQAPSRGLAVNREARIIGVDPDEFRNLLQWIRNCLSLAVGGTAPKLPKAFALRNRGGYEIANIAVPELALSLTPLGIDLVRACSRPDVL